MLELDSWLKRWEAAVLEEFGAQRVRFMGIQGSRSRGEAHECSDIDVVLVLDEFTPEDAARYRGCVENLPERDKLCGFVSGWDELTSWPGGELFSFCLDTTALYGTLDAVSAKVGREDVRDGALGTVCGIYHGCVHNFIHGRSEEALAGLYKSAFFALRAIHCLETGEKLRTRAQLLGARPDSERDLIMGVPAGSFDAGSARLMEWAARQIRVLGGRT